MAPVLWHVCACSNHSASSGSSRPADCAASADADGTADGAWHALADGPRKRAKRPPWRFGDALRRIRSKSEPDEPPRFRAAAAPAGGIGAPKLLYVSVASDLVFVQHCAELQTRAPR